MRGVDQARLGAPANLREADIPSLLQIAILARLSKCVRALRSQLFRSKAASAQIADTADLAQRLARNLYELMNPVATRL